MAQKARDADDCEFPLFVREFGRLRGDEAGQNLIPETVAMLLCIFVRASGDILGLDLFDNRDDEIGGDTVDVHRQDVQEELSKKICELVGLVSVHARQKAEEDWLQVLLEVRTEQRKRDQSSLR